MANEKKILLLLNSSVKIFVLKPIGFGKLSYFSEMRNAVLMHREGLESLYLYIQHSCIMHILYMYMAASCFAGDTFSFVGRKNNFCPKCA